MLSVASLWLPIVLSAVLVFVASSLIHMVLKWHAADYKALPNEDAVRAVVKAANLPPGQYFFPHVSDMKRMGEPEVVAKFTEGPIGHLTLRKAGPPTMGPNLAQWFVFTLVISLAVACVAATVLPAGAEKKLVFHTAGVVAFLAYAGGQIPGAIWMGKPWAVAAKEVVDSLIYGLVTAAAFMWFWPGA